jgi:hypothetical protein
MAHTLQFERFRERFGDRFISGIKTGGEYFAVYGVNAWNTLFILGVRPLVGSSMITE